MNIVKILNILFQEMNCDFKDSYSFINLKKNLVAELNTKMFNLVFSRKKERKNHDVTAKVRYLNYMLFLKLIQPEFLICAFDIVLRGHTSRIESDCRTSFFLNVSNHFYYVTRHRKVLVK